MGQFMRRNIINQRERCLYQPPVETNMPAPGATSPLGLRIGQGKAAGCAPQRSREPGQPPGQQASSLFVQPGADQCVRIRIVRGMNVQGTAQPLHFAEQCRANIQRKHTAKIVHFRQRLCANNGLRRPRLHPRPGALQPVMLLLHIAFDFGTRRPAWRMNAHFAHGHRQAQRATTARAAQLIGNGGVADLQNAAIGFWQQGAASPFQPRSRLPPHA